MKNKLLLGTLCFSGILSLSNGASAATIFTDNFNNYNIGALGFQGGWSAPGSIIVFNDPVHEGTRSVRMFSFASTTRAVKSGKLLNDGGITVYVRRFDANQPGIFSFILGEGTNAKIEVRGNYGASGKFQHVNGATASYVNFGPSFNYEIWYAVQIQWRSSDHSARYNIDGGVWTDWFPGIAPWTSGLDTVELKTVNAMAWDTIQEKPIDSKTPVLIVPGLTGTELKDGNELLWADLDRMFIDPSDSFLDKLDFSSSLSAMLPGLSYTKIIERLNVPLGLGSFDYTAGLITELQNQGYAIDENLFTFPYDWRYGVTGKYPNSKTNTDLLAEKITDILLQTQADKVDVIAHSMGGLIVKEYVKNNALSHDIGKAVFVGVPSIGAPKSVKTLLEGDNLGMFFVSDQEIKKISQNMPAIYDLLPSRQYYNTKGSYVTIIDQGFTGLNATVKDLTYDETKSFYTNDSQLNSLAVGNADSLHAQSFDNFDLRTAGIDLYAIDGCKAGTIGKIVQVKSKSLLGQTMIDYKKPEMVPGDGTVPLESSTNLPIDQSHKFYSLSGEHSKMLSQDGSRQQIINVISGSNLEVKPDLITQDIEKCELNGKAISVYSPIDITVTDQQGNKLGVAQDRSIFNEIPNAAFEIMGEHKFLYLPTDGGQGYDIQLHGTGTGIYTIKTDNIQNGETVKTQVFSNLPVTPDLTGAIHFGIGGENDFLTVQQNSGSQPETILPSPPEVVIQFDPVAKDLKFSSPEPSVTVTDQDEIITLKDQAGNVTEVKLKEKNRKQRMSAEIVELRYNGQSANLGKNSLKYTWLVDKSKNLALLVQQFKSETYTTTATFNGTTTKVSGVDGNVPVSQRFDGLKLIGVSTLKGKLVWGY